MVSVLGTWFCGKYAIKRNSPVKQKAQELQYTHDTEHTVCFQEGSTAIAQFRIQRMHVVLVD